MELPDLRLTLLMFLLVLSAFFSGSETAIFSFGKIGLGGLKQDKNAKSFFLEYLLNRPTRFLMTILLGNEVVNISISAIVASICADIFGTGNWKTGIIVSVLITTPMLLLFGEITPKAIALKNPKMISLIVIRPVFYFMKLVSPLLFILYYAMYPIEFILRKISKDKNIQNNIINEKSFLGMVDVSHEEKVIGREERDVLHNIFGFGDKTLASIMVSREKTFFFHESSTLEQILDGIKNTGFSRIPVLEDNGYRVTGILMTKKILPYLEAAGEEKHTDFNINKVIEPAISFASNAKLDHVLKILKREQQHMAIIVNQYGQLIGIATFEDLMEELFGEIHDERDVEA